MTNKQLQYLKSYGPVFENLEWNDHMVKTSGPGHTVEVANLTAVHSGRETASSFVLGKLLGAIGEEPGVEILKALEQLQVLEKENPLNGAFRWYKEESRPKDTNAAFFILAPLTTLRLKAPEYLGEKEKLIIDRMLKNSYPWFSEECAHPILWYTNKIVSDGALLTCIGKITGHMDSHREARAFLERWLNYTETRGYGWGENMSVGYNGVTLQGFSLIKSALDDKESELKDRFQRLEDRILDTFRFHNGHDFVPSMRNYNVQGTEKVSSHIFNLAGVKGQAVFDENLDNTKSNFNNVAVQLLLYGERLYNSEEEYNERGLDFEPESPRTLIVPIMDDKKAYSWLGKNGGLGSVNRFPIIAGSYQHKSWGLGWQCMPVSMIVYGEQVSFLRYNVHDGTRMRYHPHKNKHQDYLDPALFGESYYPHVRTFCVQNENTLVAFRSMTGLRNQVQSISDSLDIQRFRGSIHDLTIRERRWIVLSYKNAAICITPLEGVVSSAGIEETAGDRVNNRKTNQASEQQTVSPLRIEKSDDLRLVQDMYSGKLTTLFDDHINTGWLIHFVDHTLTLKDAEQYLQKISVEEQRSMDGEVPRMECWYVHKVKVSQEDHEIINVLYDPYESIY